MKRHPLAEPEARRLRRPGLHPLEIAAELRDRRLADVGLPGLGVGEMARQENMGEGRVRGVVHPGELAHRLGARPGLGRQQPRLRIAPVEVIADGDDLGERLAVRDQHRHLGVGIHGQVLGGLVLALVDLDELRLERVARRRPDRLEPDVRHERAGPGCEIQLKRHGFVLSPNP